MTSDADSPTPLYDLSQIESMSDNDLIERRAEFARIEPVQFHDNLSPLSFIGTAAHLVNPPLDHARRAVEKEMKRRGIQPPHETR